MKSIEKMTINELRESALELLDGADDKTILNLPISDLIDMIEEVEQSIDIKMYEELSSYKHIPSRKKKAKVKRKKTIMYKKRKNKKWMEESKKSKNVEFDITNRSYINKASHKYLKLKPNVSH